MVPDMVQDLNNLGISQEDLEAMFSSAESCLKMWEKTERVSGYRDSKPCSDVNAERCLAAFPTSK
jgi:hypothetical protein